MMPLIIIMTGRTYYDFIGNTKSIALYIGGVIYAFEAIGTVRTVSSQAYCVHNAIQVM